MAEHITVKFEANLPILQSECILENLLSRDYWSYKAGRRRTVLSHWPSSLVCYWINLTFVHFVFRKEENEEAMAHWLERAAEEASIQAMAQLEEKLLEYGIELPKVESQLNQ